MLGLHTSSAVVVSVCLLSYIISLSPCFSFTAASCEYHVSKLVFAHLTLAGEN